MKTTNLLSGAAAILALAACSSDLPQNDNSVTENDEVRFVKITIANPPSTRAEGDTEGEQGEGEGEGSSTTDNKFQTGTDTENEIKDAYFIFYDRNGDVVGTNSIINKTLTLGNGPSDKPSIGKIATTTVELQIPKGSNRPAYVIAFLNPVNYSEVSSQTNMNELRNSTRSSYKCDHQLFAMNNSAYYGKNPISGDNNVKMVGTPVYEKELHATQAAAEAADAASIDIYVERYAVKVNFSLNMNGIEDQNIGKDDKAYVLEFVPKAWTINADAPEMYASKRFENSISTNHNIPTYDEVQSMLGTWTSWNDAPNFRSYWACSPGYYATTFPAVSDDIIEEARTELLAKYEEEKDKVTDEMINRTTGAGEKIGNFELKYYSYNQIAGENSTSTGKGITAFNNSDGKVNWKYVLENTMGAAAFKCKNPKAAAPSVVIVGEYNITKGGSTISHKDGFCLYNDNLYFIGSVPANATGAKTIKTQLMDENGILAINQEGDLMVSSNASTAVQNCFEVAHPTAAVRGNMRVPHRYVTLQLKKGLKEEDLQGLFYKPTGKNTWQPIKANDDETLEEVITGINKLLWAQLGNARIYTENKGYFSIPIQHLGITENPIASETANPIAADGSVNWNNVRVGDFGLVRNHVYTLEATAIKGLASGIDGLDNPLVPSMEDDEYWIKYKINILAWRVVPTQGNIILK